MAAMPTGEGQTRGTASRGIEEVGEASKGRRRRAEVCESGRSRGLARPSQSSMLAVSACLRGRAPDAAPSGESGGNMASTTRRYGVVLACTGDARAIGLAQRGMSSVAASVRTSVQGPIPLQACRPV